MGGGGGVVGEAAEEAAVGGGGPGVGPGGVGGDEVGPVGAPRENDVRHRCVGWGGRGDLATFNGRIQKSVENGDQCRALRNQIEDLI